MKPTSERVAVFFSATALIFIPAVNFLVANDYPLFENDTLIIFFVSSLVGLFFLITSVFLSTKAQSLSIALLLAFSLDVVYELASLKLLIFPCLLFAWLTHKRFAYLVSVGCLTFLISTLFTQISPISTIASYQGNSTVDPPPGVTENPVILHILFDGYMGIHGLRESSNKGQDIAELVLGTFKNHGFQVHTRAYSQYWNSYNSIPNLLNYTSSTVSEKHLKAGNSWDNKTLEKSIYFEDLYKRGYRINIFQSDYMDLCNTTGAKITSCVTYGGRNLGVLSRTSLTSSARLAALWSSFVESSPRILRLKSGYNRINAILPFLEFPRWHNELWRGRYALASMETTSAIEQRLETAKSGEFFFVHLILPHYPYIFDSSCKLNSRPEEWLWRGEKSKMENPVRVPSVSNSTVGREDRYLEYYKQVLCTNLLLEGFVNALKESGNFEKSIIIVNGDHGSRIALHEPTTGNINTLSNQDITDAFSTLFAVKNGDSKFSLNSRQVPIQHILADINGREIQLLEHVIYLNAGEKKLRPYQYLGSE